MPVPNATTSASTFPELGLQPALTRAAAAAGWALPRGIQAAAIAAVLAGRDVLGQAPTGSGKTGAFLLPLLQHLLDTPALLAERPRRLRALVLAPTRELAVQTGAAAQALAPQIRTVVTVGGLSINPQMMALRGGAHLLVATPGRLLDLTRQNAVRLADLTVVVLDEADRLLDAGFAEETQRVLGLLPQPRQTLLFSATLPEGVMDLARAVQRDALVLRDEEAAAGVAPGAIAQRAIVVDTARRTALLRHLLRSQAWPRTLVFVATQHASEHVADKLRQHGVAAAALHGDLSQGRRSQALADLAAGRLAVLVATDLAARGIDIVELPAVVNFDLPRSAVDYTHRIGRTGRAGAAGVALSFICADAPGSEAHFRLIEKRQQQRVPRERLAGFEPVDPVSALPADPAGGVKGRRKSKKDKLREAAARGSA
jgi:superfamily II DNA/RNA helicase